MISENNELIIELWSRIKSHIPPKERLEAADIVVTVFDEFGLIEDSLMEEDLDKELRAAVKSLLGTGFDPEEEGIDYDE